MASMSILAARISRLLRKTCNLSTIESLKNQQNAGKIIKTGAGVLAVGSAVFYIGRKYNSGNVVHAARPRKRDDELQKAVRLTVRERRFIKFASVEYDGQLYMTPQDFLDSVVESEPRPRHKRRCLTDKELETITYSTPSLRYGGTHMFRGMRDKGIVSYTEYLFLLSILTKPQTGFRIAFNMFDTDGNERVDKNEFLVLRTLVAPSEEALAVRAKLRDSHQTESPPSYSNSYMENIFSHAWRGRHGGVPFQITEGKRARNYENMLGEEDQGLQRRNTVDTTLMVHFFGKDGTKELKYEGFRQFMENLQHEVLELEFSEFSKGQDTITELDFAKILLRYTYLDMDEYDKYLERLLDRSVYSIDITFEEFRKFYQFLNSLDDFSIAMRMYTLANHPISKDEFLRAVKICTGASISQHIVDTVFALFDVDGDGQLSYEEFIAIMKDRLHRGSKSQPRGEGWEAFKYCVKQEMKGP
ncbi:calcium uptake protein 3, mitochondrial isoform X2 [Diachasma alloeum]|uniref:calcium uptake protein 3, mitochondrial isoform X2 n=1 Tax=Diachasma alloeum TaxID=454923 RepID=UPI0007383F7B|nr:calcium uptake protein 3, mitochondrial isoform X2 [Diachasma alloeum]